MDGQDGSLPVCLAGGVGTLQEQGEMWAVMERQSSVAACSSWQDWRGAGGPYTATTLMVESKRLSGASGETRLTDQETTVNHSL